ncbi:MAG TPA: glycosyltransferase family 10 [Thiobacillaceae bacterium]|nr:glycosyltransferase family 10 [Thiobacillaceae bacterium]HNU64063.1 glycosyltransferase family 10 [Thiobacillaceae bacterium]
MAHTPPPAHLRIKFLGKYKPGADGAGWLKCFPDNVARWGNCDFVFDRNCRDYDWLVVYDDLPSLAGERHPLWVEELACPPEHTLLLLTEPSSIKTYGRRYLRQYRWILSTQEPWATGNHPGRIVEQPALIWFYADTSPRGDYNTLVRHVPRDKTLELSTVCSSKRQGHTLHRARYDFTQDLKRLLPGLDIYGHGVRPLVDKADALDPYRYHLAIENYLGPHHWTEKLADAFLGACLPVYYGCPNAEDYFPPESFLRIDIHDPQGAAETIRRAIRDGLWEKRLPAILEARRRVLERYGTIATIARLVNERHRPRAYSPAGQPRIQSRRRLHRQLLPGLLYALEKVYVRGRHALARED